MLAVAGGETVAQEEHVELAALGRGGDVLHQFEIGPARDGVGMPPPRDVMARRLHEDTEPHRAVLHRLLIHGFVLSLQDL
jgi:hypothetical protein